jgi:phosphoribosylpyrophosphate synthetase
LKLTLLVTTICTGTNIVNDNVDSKLSDATAIVVPPQSGGWDPVIKLLKKCKSNATSIQLTRIMDAESFVNLQMYLLYNIDSG